MRIMRVNIMKPVFPCLKYVPWAFKGYIIMYIEEVNVLKGVEGMSGEEQKWYSMNMSVCLPVIFITLNTFQPCVFVYFDSHEK